jgi:hypothetical protein
MSLPIKELATQAVETIFSLTSEMSHGITIKMRADSTGGGYTYDPVTGTHDTNVDEMVDLDIADVRILKFSDKEIRDSNGAITPNSRKIYARYADLNGASLYNSDAIELPNGQIVEIDSIKYLPDEFNPVFMVLGVSGVNQP